MANKLFNGNIIKLRSGKKYLCIGNSLLNELFEEKLTLNDVTLDQLDTIYQPLYVGTLLDMLNSPADFCKIII